MTPRSTAAGHRGAMLLEVLLALTLLVTAGLVILSLLAQAADAIAATREREKAVDLARSALARIEAGIDTPESLDGPVPVWTEPGEAFDDRLPEPSGWELEIETEPGPISGLTWVSVTARRPRPGTAGEAGRAGATLRQIVRLPTASGGRAGAEQRGGAP